MFWHDADCFQEDAKGYYWRACKSIELGNHRDAVIYQDRAAYFYKRAREIVDREWLSKLGSAIPEDEFTMKMRLQLYQKGVLIEELSQSSSS